MSIGLAYSRSRSPSLLALASFIWLLCAATTLPAFAQTNQVPTAAPENFTAAGQDRQVTLSWGTLADATGYNLWRDSGSGYVHFATISGSTSYTDAGLINGTFYQYAINAVNAAGPSPQFAFASATTTLPIPDKGPVAYTSIQGADLLLFPWEGKNLVLLTASPNYDPSVMARILTTLDAAYAYYATVTGRTPSLYKNINGKATIAEVAETCGAGCGYLGATGIEIMPAYFNTLYSQVAANNLYDQVLFYELGRNFSFYINQVEYKDSNLGTVITGYAVYMRFKSMEAAGAQGAPFNGHSFESFKSEVAGLVDSYEADPSLNWENTLKIGKAPPNAMNLGGPDLLASMIMRLERDYGGEAFVRRFWQEVGNQPSAVTTNDALNNFVRAASAAAGTDLTSLFQNRWRWPLQNKINASPDALVVQEDGSASLNPLVNDADPAGHTLVIERTSQGAHGSVGYTGTSVIYTPRPNYNGSDSFTYTIVNNNGGAATATVTVTVTPVNDAPVAVADAVSMQRNGTSLFLVASNDTDVDGDTLTVVSATFPGNAHKCGSVTLEGGGVRFTPKKNFKGITTFTYTLSDGKGGTATGSVTVNVQK